MNNYDTIKELLLDSCTHFVNQRMATVNEVIDSNQKALSSETKSSAGDKHETGRAMLQLEMEKASQQLMGIDTMKIVLSKIEIKTSPVIALGSLVFTNNLNFFLAISAGEIKIDSQIFYAVSTNSPIGQLLLGKKAGDTVNFTKEMLIKAVY